MRFAAVLLVALSFAPAIAPGSRPEHKVVTLLFTNDVESAYDPIPAFWRNDLESRWSGRGPLHSANRDHLRYPNERSRLRGEPCYTPRWPRRSSRVVRRTRSKTSAEGTHRRWGRSSEFRS